MSPPATASRRAPERMRPPLVSDGVMVARAEFGTELEWPAVPPERQSWKSCFVGLDAATGAQKWKLEGPGLPSPDNTPIVRATAGQHEFILAASVSGVMGIDAASGT